MQHTQTFLCHVFLSSYTAGPPGGMGGMDMSALAGMMGGNIYRVYHFKYQMNRIYKESGRVHVTQRMYSSILWTSLNNWICIFRWRTTCRSGRHDEQPSDEGGNGQSGWGRRSRRFDEEPSDDGHGTENDEGSEGTTVLKFVRIKCNQEHSCPFLLRMLCGRYMNIKSLNWLLFYYTYFCFTSYIGELLFAEIWVTCRRRWSSLLLTRLVILALTSYGIVYDTQRACFDTVFM